MLSKKSAKTAAVLINTIIVSTMFLEDKSCTPAQLARWHSNKEEAQNGLRRLGIPVGGTLTPIGRQADEASWKALQEFAATKAFN